MRILIVFLIIFQLGCSIKFDLPVPTREEMKQYERFIKLNENNEPELNLSAFDLAGIIDVVNGVLESISNVSQPLYQSELSLVLPSNSILPVAGVLKFNDLLLEYDNFDGSFDMYLVLGILPTSLKLHLSFDRLYVKTSYENLFKLGYEVNDYVPNKGRIETTIEAFSFDLHISKFHFADLSNLISKLTTSLDVDRIKVDLTGFINDDLVSNELAHILSDVLVPYWKENIEEANELLSATLKSLLNKIIFEIINAIVDAILGHN